MARSKSSGRWLQEHFNDPYVQMARDQGYRARSAFKLLELQEKDHLIRPGMAVVDLGAAPGGWSQVCAKLLHGKGQILAMDILSMEPIEGVDYIQGDFTEEAVYDALLQRLGGRVVDLVLCDIAPNMSGIDTVDQPKAMYMAELAFDFALQVLKPGGCFAVKVFQGRDFDTFLAAVKSNFKQVFLRKPKSSRSRSRETYLVAKNYKS